MGIEHKLWEKQGKKCLKRREGNRGTPKDIFLIVCEGEKTEPNYFKSFGITSINVEVVPTGANTDKIVEVAKKFKKEMKNGGIKVDQVWCVFDKDSFSPQSFNRALQLAENNNIKVAYSNPHLILH